jgi:hypothetical protein
LSLSKAKSLQPSPKNTRILADIHQGVTHHV